MMKSYTKNGIRYFKFESFEGGGVQDHAVFSRLGGVSEGALQALNMSTAVRDDEAAVRKNRAMAYGVLGRDQNSVVHAHLIHGAHVTRVTSANHGQLMPRTDGLITNDLGCALTMNFADCTPIFIFDPVNHAIGLGHAGWQGALADLPGALVRAMAAEFGSRPSQLLAAIGPTICHEHYEVDEPLVSRARAAFPDIIDQLLTYPNGRDRRPHFNLPLTNKLNLMRAGVEQVEMSGYCSAETTDLFFSHRAEKGKTGRFGSLFVLLGTKETMNEFIA